MNLKDKEKIIELRIKGFGYKKIASELSISVNTVKSYCQRNGLNGTGNDRCKNCGVLVKQNPKRKKKKFCSDKCRLTWWNSHQDKINKRANYTLTCNHCGKNFISYGNKNRKYCSHSCYISARFCGNENGQ